MPCGGAARQSPASCPPGGPPHESHRRRHRLCRSGHRRLPGRNGQRRGVPGRGRSARSRMLNDGGIPIHEPGLEAIVQRNAAAGRLQFTTDVAAAVAHGTIQFIGVGTPPDEDGSADMQYVLAAAASIGRHMTDYKVIVDKSTVPVGTADRCAQRSPRRWRERGVEHGLRGGLQPRVPEGRRGGRRLHAARPHHRGRRRRARHPADARAVRALHAQPRPAAGDGRAQRRVHQVRRQRHAGHAHQLHERAGAAGRARGRRHRAGAPGHRQRPAHRHALPVCRLRLRRLLLSQGREGADPHRPAPAACRCRC